MTVLEKLPTEARARRSSQGKRSVPLPSASATGRWRPVVASPFPRVHRGLAALFLLAAAAVSGCGQAIQTPLPELSATGQTGQKEIVAEQKKAAMKGMEDLTQKAASRQSEALKEIESTR